MSVYQICLAAALLLATLVALTDGRNRPWVLLLVVWGNFGATMALNEDPVNVAILDTVAFALLVYHGRRAAYVAGLFLLMVPVYIAGIRLGVDHYVIYSIVEVLAYMQFLIIGWPDGGCSRYIRSWGRFWPYGGHNTGLRHKPAGRVQEEK